MFLRILAFAPLLAAPASATLHEIRCRPMTTCGEQFYTDCGLSPDTYGCRWNDVEPSGWGTDGRIVPLCDNEPCTKPRRPIFQFIDGDGKIRHVPFWSCDCDGLPMREGEPCK